MRRENLCVAVVPRFCPVILVMAGEVWCNRTDVLRQPRVKVRRDPVGEKEESEARPLSVCLVAVGEERELLADLGHAFSGDVGGDDRGASCVSGVGDDLAERIDDH